MDFHEAYTDTCSSVGIAARVGNLDTLKKLIDEDRAVDVKDNRGWTPLHEAAYNGHTQCLDLLLKQEEVDVNWKAFEGETALLLACRQSKRDTITRLLEAGADKDLSTNEQITPLFEACDHKSLDCARLLLEAGCNVNHQVYTGDTALHSAVERDCADIVKLLLDHKADVCACSHHYLTPVFVAAQFGKDDCLKLLLDEAKFQGKQHVVNMTASDNASPLLIACHYGRDKCVELLLDNGADPTLKVLLDGEDITMDPLQYAVKFGHKRCLRLVLQHSGIDPQNYQHDELNPLRLAVDHEDIDCLQMLIERGFKIDDTYYTTGEGYGSLLCFSPSVDAAKHILLSGFSLANWKPTLVHADGCIKRLDPLLESLGNEKLTEILLIHGAKIRGNEYDFWNAVFTDRKFLRVTPDRSIGNTCFIYLMIKYGCNVNKCVGVFLRSGTFLHCLVTFQEGLFFLLYVLSVNIKTPSHFWENMETETDIDVELWRKVEAESYTLKHACRVAVVRQMISLDTWDSKGVKNLGELPRIIQNYLKYKEYKYIGKHFMNLCPLLRNYLKGSRTSDLLLEMRRLVHLSRSKLLTSSDDSQ